MPVSVNYVMLSQFRGFYDRARDPLQSTEFSFSRFLVPYLCGFDGWALFFDGDMLCRKDVAELWALRDGRYAVQVVQRAGQEVTEHQKFLGRPQTAYARKNWSSVMLMNCEACRQLTPEYVEHAHGLELHQFRWLRDRDIGQLPAAWNHLVGVDRQNPAAKLAHFTLGMPYFPEHARCEYADEWRAEADAMQYVEEARV